MKNIFPFEDHKIQVWYQNDIPHFCASDIAKACGYESSLPIYAGEANKLGRFNYLPLSLIEKVLGRAGGGRRDAAQRLMEAIQKEYLAAMPVQKPVVAPAVVASDFELRIRRKQTEMELEELHARKHRETADINTMQAALHEAQRLTKETDVKIIERERELDGLRPRGVGEAQPRLIKNG